MANAMRDVVRKALAVAVLLVAAFVLLKVVIGLIASVAWIIVGVIAVIAVIWALRVL